MLLGPSRTRLGNPYYIEILAACLLPQASKRRETASKFLIQRSLAKDCSLCDIGLQLIPYGPCRVTTPARRSIHVERSRGYRPSHLVLHQSLVLARPQRLVSCAITVTGERWQLSIFANRSSHRLATCRTGAVPTLTLATSYTRAATINHYRFSAVILTASLPRLSPSTQLKPSRMP